MAFKNPREKHGKGADFTGMSSERVKEVLIAAGQRILNLGPLFGPTREERAVVTGCITALDRHPEVADTIAKYVGPYQRQDMGGTLTPVEGSFSGAVGVVSFAPGEDNIGFFCFGEGEEMPCFSVCVQDAGYGQTQVTFNGASVSDPKELVKQIAGGPCSVSAEYEEAGEEGCSVATKADFTG